MSKVRGRIDAMLFGIMNAFAFGSSAMAAHAAYRDALLRYQPTDRPVLTMATATETATSVLAGLYHDANRADD